MTMLAAKHKKIIGLVLKIIIVAFAYGYILIHLFADENSGKMLDSFSQINDSGKWGVFFFVVLLMGLNRIMEAIKWRILIDHLEKISFKVACKAILAGITVSIFTPNKIGDFGGRIFYLKKANRWKATLATLLGNYSQTLTTLFFGVVAPFFADINWLMFYDYIVLIQFAGLVVVSLLLLFYYNISLIGKLSMMLNHSNKVKEYLEVFSIYSSWELSKVLMLSLMRFAVFSFQYWLLLGFFDIEINYGTGFLLISMIFMLQTFIPSITLADIGIRGSLAIYFFSIYSSNKLGIVGAATTLWLINIILPAILGSFFIGGLKFFRNNND